MSKISLDFKNKTINIEEDFIDDLLMKDEEEPLNIQCPKTGYEITFSIAPSNALGSYYFKRRGIVFDAEIGIYESLNSAHIQLYTYWDMYKRLIRNKGMTEKILKEGKGIRFYEEYMDIDTDWHIKLI